MHDACVFEPFQYSSTHDIRKPPIAEQSYERFREVNALLMVVSRFADLGCGDAPFDRDPCILKQMGDTMAATLADITATEKQSNGPRTN